MGGSVHEHVQCRCVVIERGWLYTSISFRLRLNKEVFRSGKLKNDRRYNGQKERDKDKKKNKKKTTMIHKILKRKLKILQNEPH